MKLLVALAALALALPASAQSVSRSGYARTLDYAGCVVIGQGADARALLATAPESAEEKAALAKLAADPKCPAKEANDKAIRGAVAERVYLADYAAAPEAPAGEPPAFQGSGDANLANWDVTRCAVTRDPAGADMLVRSELGSAAQRDAIKRIVPVIGSCTPMGAKIGFDREKMRGLIAEGLLRTRGAAAGTP
jgi:hypothetical protein